jgi:hypothetical protein
VIYVRWRRGESRRGKVCGPLAPDHGMHGADCVLCEQPLAGEPVQLIIVGPHPDDPNAEDKHEAGRWYNASAAIGHEGCVTASSDERLDRLCNDELIIRPVRA